MSSSSITDIKDINNLHSKEFTQLGNEPGYRRLGNEEEVKEGDETFGIFGQHWTQANRYQIGEKAGTVGGFYIWRRKND